MIKSVIAIAFYLVFIYQGYTQTDTLQLIKPTGKYTVGTSIYEWVDQSRVMKIRPDFIQKRTIIAQFWFPVSSVQNLKSAPYAPLSKDYTKTLTNSFLRAPISLDIENAPLILIVPGRGTERFLYSTIAEELASQGFVVVSVDMPEIGYVTYQDGFTLFPSDEFKTPNGMMAGPYERVDEFYEKPTEMGYEDISFVIDKIKKLNTIAFNGKIDLNNIGVFGHSLGGRIAGEFTARCKKVKALVTMEGIPPRDVRYEGKIKIPSLMLCSSGTLKYALENYNSFIDNRKGIVYMAELSGFGHNSLTDNPFLYPKNFKYEIEPKKALEISRVLLTAFFTEFLLDKAGVFEASSDLDLVKISKYE